ncbi:MAG: hypothetical protein K1W30_03265 [Lachnospiraceae bacterium]
MSRSNTLPKFSLNSFVSPQTKDWYKNVDYQDAKNIIKEKMKSSVENFIAIGYHLKHIDETEQYKEDGYANIWECAKMEFGFSQAKASRCINICKAYSRDGDSPYIDERFRDFNPSQLQEMLPFKDDEHLIGQITPDMSSREIRKEVRNTKKGCAGDAKESDALPEELQITTIEGEYREFVPDNKDSSKETKTQVENSAEIIDSREESMEAVYMEEISLLGTTVFINDGVSIDKGVVEQITLRKAVETQFGVCDTDGGAWRFFYPSDFGSILFFTYEDAANNKREEKRDSEQAKK